MVDPVLQEMVTSAGGKLTATRKEKILGMDTTRYTITIDMEEVAKKFDLRKFLASAPGEIKQIPGLSRKERDELTRGLDLSDAQLAKGRKNLLKVAKDFTTTRDLWVNAQGLPVQETVDSEFQGRQLENLTVVYSDWGKAAITVPPASQVAPFP